MNKFNFWLLLITYSDKCKFLCMCPLLMRLIRNYFFRIFWKFINHFLKSEATRIYVNGTTRNLVKNSTYFWPQREPYSHLIWIDDFSIHVYVVWVTFPHFHPITYLSEILVLQNWSLTRVLSQTVCIHLGYDISM